MKAGWEVRPLGEVAGIVNGGTPKTSIEDYWGGGVLWLTPKEMGTVNGAAISSTERTISQSGLDHSSALLVPENSVILSTRAPIGYLAINAAPMAFNQGCRGIVPSAKLDPFYLRYFLQANVALLNSLGTGATFKELSASNLKRVEIPVPSLEEQKRIVARLDVAFAAIDTARRASEAARDNARALFDARLNQIFAHPGEGWEEKGLEEVGKIQTGLTPKTSEPQNYGDFIPFVKPADFKANGGLRLRCEGLSEAGLKQGRCISAGSALMVCIGATIGKSGYCDVDITTNQQINSITPFPGNNYKFIYYSMICDKFQYYVIQQSARATIPIINKKKWANLPLALPPLEEQQHIVAMLDIMNDTCVKLDETHKEKLHHLDALRQALLRQAFAGELTADAAPALEAAL